MDSELLAVTGPSVRRAYSPITTPLVYKGIVRSRAEQSIGRTQRTVVGGIARGRDPEEWIPHRNGQGGPAAANNLRAST